MPSAPRRRPPSPPPAPPAGEPAVEPAAAGAGPFRLIALGGGALIVVVVAVAFLTGTADDLPWGALIGVVILLGAMLVTARRRERRMRDAFPEDDA